MCCHRPKKPKKKKQKVKEDPAAKVSGPSNAEEAQLMRNVLGFAAPLQSPASSLTPTSAPAPQQPQPQLQAVATQPAPQHAPQVIAPQYAPQVVAPQQAQAAQQQSAPQQQQAQAAPIQPQQQSTFRFGFGVEVPGEAAPTAGGSQASAAAQQVPEAAAQQAPQAAAQQALPGPPIAAEAATDFVARRVFVGGMPFTYEVIANCLVLLITCLSIY